MITDRELLERAAKAVNGGSWNPLTHAQPWNPLTDDGDALRLAVKLGIVIDPDFETLSGRKASRAMRYNPNGEPWIACETHADDACAATRRAIVRAAAAIGSAS